MAKYGGIKRTSIRFNTLRYGEFFGGDKILKVNFDVPLAQKTDPHFHSKNSVSVELLATGGLIRVDSSHERSEDMKARLKDARKVMADQLQKKPNTKLDHISGSQ